MSQPMPALLLTLLVGTTAAAQPSALVRERVERRITLPASPKEPLPEVHIAPGALTNLILDAPVDRASVELASRASHFKLVEVAEHTLLLEPSVELGPQERVGLRLRLKDGTPVALVLTSHPTQVDGRVDLERPLSAEAARAQLNEARTRLAALEARCGQDELLRFILSGLLDEGGVQVTRLTKAPPSTGASEPTLASGLGYRANLWAAVALEVSPPAGAQPRALGEVRLVAPGGVTVKPVLVSPSQGRLLLRMPKPHWKEGTEFRLEASNANGPPLFLGMLKL